MRTFAVELPETVDSNDQELRLMLSSRLYEKGKLSLGQAAAMAGFSIERFMELLGSFNVPIFHYDPKELKDDLKNAGDYYKRH